MINPPATAASAAAVMPAVNDPPIPKISLSRRESVSGPTWMRTVNTEAPVTAATGTENTISNMLSVIRATFRPITAGVSGLVQVEAATQPEKEKEQMKGKTAGTIPVKSLNERSSSATRGRGLQRKQ